MSQWNWYAHGLEGERRFQDRDPRELYEEHLARALEERMARSHRRHGYAYGFEVPSMTERDVQLRERTGPGDYRRSDGHIVEDIGNRLAVEPGLDPSEIEICVRDGRVTLAGQVHRRWMRSRAERVAESVFGVREVDNRLRVKRGS